MTAFLYDELNPVQELAGGLPAATLVTGLEIDEYFTRTDALGARHFLTDALGSTVALSDGSGAVQTEYTYEPFGGFTTSGAGTGNTFAFTGREADGTGLMYYRARYYDPFWQRFASQDPVGFAGGLNLFTYVANGPISFQDPLGLQRRTPAQGQPPNSTQWYGNRDGSVTRREFGPDGRAVRDFDYGQKHGYDPEVHDWDWSKDPPRQPGRRYPKELPPGEPAPDWPHPPLPKLPWGPRAFPWIVPIVNPCVVEPTICVPPPSKTWASNLGQVPVRFPEKTADSIPDSVKWPGSSGRNVP